MANFTRPSLSMPATNLMLAFILSSFFFLALLATELPSPTSPSSTKSPESPESPESTQSIFATLNSSSTDDQHNQQQNLTLPECMQILFSHARACSVRLQLGARFGSRALSTVAPTTTTTWNQTFCCKMQALHGCLKEVVIRERCEERLAYTGVTGRFQEKDRHCSVDLLKKC